MIEFSVIAQKQTGMVHKMYKETDLSAIYFLIGFLESAQTHGGKAEIKVQNDKTPIIHLLVKYS